MNKLRSITDSWIATPFKQSIGVKGIGTDCYHLMINLIQEISNISPLNSIPVFFHGQEHNNVVTITEQLYHCDLIDKIIPGTLLYFKIGKLYFLGMSIEENLMITVNETVGVCYTDIKRFTKYLEYKMYPKVFKNLNL